MCKVVSIVGRTWWKLAGGGGASIAACEDGWWGRAGHCHLWWVLTCREDSQKLAVFSVYNIYMVTCGLWPANTLSNIIYQMMLLNNFKRSMCNNITSTKTWSGDGECRRGHFCDDDCSTVPWWNCFPPQRRLVNNLPVRWRSKFKNPKILC